MCAYKTLRGIDRMKFTENSRAISLRERVTKKPEDI